jgi:hypothetical protein
LAVTNVRIDRTYPWTQDAGAEVKSAIARE